METIAISYQRRQFSNCITALNVLLSNCSSLSDELIIGSNLIVCQIQAAYSAGDSKQLDCCVGELCNLWSKLLSLPPERDCLVLTWSVAANILYSWLIHHERTLNRQTALDLGIRALERASIQLGSVPLCETCSVKEKLKVLTDRLIQSNKLYSTEKALLLYIVLLLSLFDEDQHCAELMRAILDHQSSNVQCSVTEPSLFILAPVNLSLIAHLPQFSQIVCDFAKIVLVTKHYCQNSLWEEALSIMSGSVASDLLRPIWDFIKLYAKFNLKKPVGPNFSSDENCDEYLLFAKYLFQAVLLAEDKKPSIALQFLKMAVDLLGATQAGCIPVVYTALQFQKLGECELEMQAWTVAEDMLSNNPPLPCRLHCEPVGFLLTHLGLLRMPSLLSIQYHLARALLNNRLYDRAVVSYDRIADASNGDLRAGGSVSWMGLSKPTVHIVTHELVLALLLAKMLDRAVDAIQSAPDQDFVLLYLHSQVAASMKQMPTAVRLINRSIQKMKRTVWHPEEMGKIIESKLNWKLATLYNSMGNTKEALHQLRVALQQNPADSQLVAHYQNIITKTGVNIASLTPLDPKAEKSMKEMTENYLLSNDDLSLRYLIEN